MFSTSIGLLLCYLIAYIFVPLIPGIISVHLIAWTHLRGRIFYFVSWFVGVGVVGYGLFLSQFVRFGVDRAAYIWLILLLLIALIIRMRCQKWTWKQLCQTWKIELPFNDIRADWAGRSTLSKTIVVLLSLFVCAFIVTTFVFVAHFPSYADDAFGNWHLPVINILYDGGIKIFGQATEILGRARLGYPIMIPTFQAFITHIAGGYNDIYINLFPWLSVVFFLGLIKTYIFTHTKSLLHALLWPALVISLPLIFMHTTQGYMDLLSALYTVLAIIFFYQWIGEEGKTSDLLIGATFLSILSYVKNDGFVVYMMWVLIALALYFIMYRKVAAEKLKIFTRSSTWIALIIIVLFFIAPFTFIKSYYHLGFNQAAGANAGLGLASLIHWEIFPVLWKTIYAMNNFSLAPFLMVGVILHMLVEHKKVLRQKWFLLLAPVVILCIFLAVFLFTENYKFVLDQTTSNRVLTMVLVIFFSYVALLRDVAAE